MERIKALEAEIERLRAARANVLAQIARLVDDAPPVTSGCHPLSWGTGFQTAHQMVLNILNQQIASGEK
jgi:hypothetical protein